MTAPDEPDRDLLAAEYVLGLLDADARAAAERRLHAEPGFAAEVAAWEARLLALTETLPPVTPSEQLRARIMAVALAANDDPVTGLQARGARRWRALAGGMSALAAALAVIVGIQLTRTPPEPAVVAAPAAPNRPILVASLSSADSATSLAVAYDRGDSVLTVAPGQVTPAAGHDHELWIIPEGGAPASLGLIRAGAAQRIAVSRALAPHFRRDATVALSVEPTGGSRTGLPTGPVVASGKLGEI